MQIKPGTVIACKHKKFKNDKGAAHHPFLVVKSNGVRLQVLVCTDANHKYKFPNSVDIDHSMCGLTKPTCVICSKYTVVSISDVSTVIGNITHDDFKSILNELSSNGSPKYFENWRQLP